MEYILISACLLGINCRYDGIGKMNEKAKALVERKDIVLLPVCPEQLGGMETPREPSERKGDGVWNRKGEDVTEYYRRGAQEVLKLAGLYQCSQAILKERSPSCGSKKIYDGSFSRTLTDGEGVTAELLRKYGIRVVGESEI